MNRDYVIGVDFGTDSVRAAVVDSKTGQFISSAISEYRRWKEGLYIDEKKNIFRQHPLDYIESFSLAIRNAVEESGKGDEIGAISIDTTGSTPCLVDENLCPISLLPGFENDPDGMFILWKDHSSALEAEEINELAHGQDPDYTKYSGGTYSSEWFWAKIFHVLRNNERVRARTYTALEHCDWMPVLLTGCKDNTAVKRSRCAAGHKGMWNALWSGYPHASFFEKLDKDLARIALTMPSETYTAEKVFGNLSEEWTEKLGLDESVVVTVGSIDAHAGAVGGGIKEGVMVMNVGTSTCDIAISKNKRTDAVKGICGEVDGSVISGYIGYEAGQSAWGDYYSWLRNILLWTPKRFGGTDSIEGVLLAELEKDASMIPLSENDPVALDWINGRRTPDAEPKCKAMWAGLSLSVDAPALMKMLLESTAFGFRAILECLTSQGVVIEKIVALGGVARKSFYGMQILADVSGRDIEIADCSQSSVLGCAIYGAVASGIYGNIEDAVERIGAKCGKVYHPDPERMRIYNKLYSKYIQLSKFENGFRLEIKED